VPGLTSRKLLYALGIGLAAGLNSGLLGVGGGVILVPGMVVLLGVSQRPAIANSLAAIIPMAAVGALVYYFAGPTPHVRLDLALALALGGTLGAILGARLAHRLSERTLRIFFGLLVLVVSIRLLLVGNAA
jgi:uncharacterized membrane protein YfcA